MNGFALVGGSAVALVLHHRVSDDLIFAWVGERLPRAQLELVGKSARAAGISWEPPDVKSKDPTVADHQQGFLAENRVRVTFFTPDPPLARLLHPAQPRAPVRVATYQEQFALTALLTAQRTRLRDWFDLYELMREQGFKLDDFHDAFVRAGLADRSEPALSGICDGSLRPDDPGYAALLPDAPDAPALREFFRNARDQRSLGR